MLWNETFLFIWKLYQMKTCYGKVYQKFENGVMDGYYVMQRSLFIDITIINSTLLLPSVGT